MAVQSGASRLPGRTSWSLESYGGIRYGKKEGHCGQRKGQRHRGKRRQCVFGDLRQVDAAIAFRLCRRVGLGTRVRQTGLACRAGQGAVPRGDLLRLPPLASWALNCSPPSPLRQVHLPPLFLNAHAHSGRGVACLCVSSMARGQSLPGGGGGRLATWESGSGVGALRVHVPAPPLKSKPLSLPAPQFHPLYSGANGRML